MIQIDLVGNERTDGTTIYNIITDHKTVGDFINEWLYLYPTYWGTFGIRNNNFTLTNNEPYYNAKCEYEKGKIVSQPFSKNILKSEILKVSGSGGYTNSDFDFTI